MNLDQALQTFLSESRELLQEMEDSLLRMEHGSDEGDVNAVFRAAHTIKGSAGLFGLDGIVEFTHSLETVLDIVRNEELLVTAELVALFLECADHLRLLVEGVAAGDESAEQQLTERAAELIPRLHGYMPGTQRETANSDSDSGVDLSGSEESGVDSATTDNWHISLRFSGDVLRSGMDPLSFIRYLSTLGEIVAVSVIDDSLPSLAEIDPEACYLGFEISFKSNESKQTIEDVFEFVREDSEIYILPPHSLITEYVELIQEISGEDLRLGEILIGCGTLTRSELERALALQKEVSAGAGDAVEGQESVTPVGEILVREKDVQPKVVNAALERQRKLKDGRAAENSTLRIQASKLDSLINLVGELVIAGASASLLAKTAGETALYEATSTVSRLVEEIRDNALQLRTVEIGTTFNRFQRVVHDVGKELGKEINLVINGAETELDKSVVEKIGDPLTHLVRNSIDHGIEPHEVRRERGKPERGTVSLNAFHDSGSIVIEVSDDGGGLSRDRILAKAVEREIVHSGEAMSDQEIFNLIFEPGFSTADQVSNISGRGVGMDVVRRNIEALRGTVEVDSKESVGTTIRIRLPLTLAIIDGFLMGVGEAAYVVPLDSVVECVELAEAERKTMRDHNYINLRGEVLPFIRLRDHFGHAGVGGRRENIVVIQCSGRKAGLMVDRLMGEFQTVIKPLGRLFGNLAGVTGSTILGSGEVALILDAPALVQQVASAEESEVRGGAARHAVSG